MNFKSDTGETAQIMVSFNGKWGAAFRATPPTVVFRHKTPISQPHTMYLYIGAPQSAVIGKCHVKTIERITNKAALALAADGRIGKAELAEYLEGHNDVGVYHIDRVRCGTADVLAKDLKKHSRFFPPQSFLFLTDDGARLLDQFLK